MASKVALDLLIELKGDKAAAKGLESVGKEAGKLDKGMGALGKVMGGLAVGGIAAVGGALVWGSRQGCRVRPEDGGYPRDNGRHR